VSFFSELKRRNVVRVGIAYAVTAWLVLQLADIIVDNFTVPGWMMSAIVLLLVCGFPIALVFAWAFELTPEGVKREKDVERSQSITRQTGRKLDRAIIVVLVLALGYFVFDKFSPVVVDSEPAAESAQAEPAPDDQPGQDERVAQKADIPDRSIAVLPFVNMSSDADQEYFSDGISEELLNVLAKFPGVHVAARTSSFQFKGQNRDIGEIAKLLKVRHVLEGSVRKAGNQVRITAQLIEAETGYHLWSETYDRQMDDIFAVQDEISAAIGDAMRVELAVEGQAVNDALRVAETANTAAYEAYLKGRHLVNQRGRRNLFAARDHLQRSVRLDPDYAPAQALLAINYSLLLAGPSTYGDYTQDEMLTLATPHAERAIELDPNLAEAHGALGLLAMNKPDYQKALEELSIAIELNPVYADAVTWHMLSAQAIGDWESARAGARRTIEIDPLSIVGRMNYSGVLAIEDLAAAREMADSIMEQNAWAGYTSRGMVEMSAGELDRAVYWLLRAYGQDPSDEFSNQGLVYALSLLGEHEEASRITDRSRHVLEYYQGNREAAIHLAREELAKDPNNSVAKIELGEMLYAGKQFEEAAAYFADVMKDLPDGGILLNPNDLTHSTMMRYAWSLLQTGDEAAARDLIDRHRRSYLARQKADFASGWNHYAEAMSRVIEGDVDGAMVALERAMEKGYRDRVNMQEPVFDPVRNHPAFMAITSRIDKLLAEQNRRALVLMCHENPVPETWQPLRKTCLGVSAQKV
jgi:TolB-like protein/tetratricopeptide (TPR) repeat protein